MVKYLNVKYRAITEKDIPFLYNAFIRHIVPSKNSKGVYPYNRIDKSLMSMLAHSLMTRMLKCCDVVIMCNQDYEDQIFGYMIYKDDDLYWIYVKYDYRGVGMAREVINNVFGDKQINVIIPTPAFSWMKEKWDMVLQPANISKLVRKNEI